MLTVGFFITLLAESSTPPSSQVAYWKWTAGVALATVIIAVVEAFFSLRHRRSEIRWKQAELARALINSWFDWPASSIALQLLDEGEGLYDLKGYGPHQIDPATAIPHALALTAANAKQISTHNTAPDRLIRKCFDVLLFQFERAEHSIKIGVIHAKDVHVPAAYYIRELARFKSAVTEYSRFAGFNNALDFLSRFNGWNETA